MQNVWQTIHQYVPFTFASGKGSWKCHTIAMSTLSKNENKSISIEEAHRTHTQLQSAYMWIVQTWIQITIGIIGLYLYSFNYSCLAQLYSVSENLTTIQSILFFCLQRHTKIHIRGELFKCDYCPKQYSQQRDSTKHMKNVHPIEWNVNQNKQIFGNWWIHALIWNHRKIDTYCFCKLVNVNLIDEKSCAKWNKIKLFSRNEPKSRSSVKFLFNYYSSHSHHLS